MKCQPIMIIASLAVGLLLNLPSQAHEGHNHGATGPVAPHGGALKTLPEFSVEAVKVKGGVKVYVLDQAMKPLAAGAVKKVTGKVTFPKKAEATSVDFVSKEDGFEAKIDPKGAHRYTLDLEITKADKEKPDKATFQIEPMD